MEKLIKLEINSFREDTFGKDKDFRHELKTES